ncbi:DUF4224 domain-containing protein [Variovorax sp. PAMC26660]|uniref:DUF4224 domain-containing protein n=1 Tax=Variovorax sp. PAMC26660 TaxID=2762322 RepID=UPI00164D020F|nr:DUF4224 domain-containing protein [Variovorax sp. PAMC26660]QNK66057.1 hypothetical protein H7F35_23025 [Variovorax sp. PAMC26660]
MTTDPNRPDMSDEEIDQICLGLSQNLAKVRYLRRLGLRVDRRPNGRPLVARIEWARLYGPEAQSAPPAASNGPRWKTPAGAR